MASLISRPAPEGDTIVDQTIPAGAAVISIDDGAGGVTPIGYAGADDPGTVHLFTGDDATGLLPAGYAPTDAGSFPVADDTAASLLAAEGERPVAAPPDDTVTPPPDDTTTPPPDTGTTPPETGGTVDADFVVDARTLAADIAAHAPVATMITDISSLFAHMLAAFTGALADIVASGAGTPSTGGSTTPPDTVPPVVTPPTTDPGTATGGDPSTVPSSGAGCWASQHPTAATIPATDHTANV